nr:MAG TPA: minor capsid protein [Caudoviricetes sp.]
MSITQEQEKEISALYHQIYKEYKKEMNSLPLKGKGTTSQSLRKAYLNKLTKQLKEAYEELDSKLESQIKSGMEKTAQATVDGVKEWTQKAGLTVEGVYSYVPKDVVSMLSTGKLYGEGWTLSKSIWGQEQKTLHDIDQIVAKGVAANKSAYDIAKDLEKYVDPSAKKEWDWSRVYPGTPKKIDYNAQRLARTMVSHAYQQSLLASTKYNPFVKGYRWRSAHSSRTCEICNERDGKIYSADNLPLDHPNGLCTFIAELSDSMSDIADRLADWALGKEDPSLDRWYNSMGGKPLEEKVTKEQKKKATTPKDVTIGSTKWIDKNFSNMRKNITREFGKEAWIPIRDKLSSLDETRLMWLSSGNSRLKELINDRGQGYYLPRDRIISVDILKDISPSNTQGRFSTLFHEYGHLLDDKYGPAGRGLSSLGDFGRSIYKSLQTEYNNIVDKSTGRIVQEVRDSLIRDDHSSGVQDIISGLSGNSNCIRWGHSSEYWAKGGVDAWHRVTSEAFANMNSAYINGGKAEQYFEEVFPESYRLFKEEVANIVQREITKTMG